MYINLPKFISPSALSVWNQNPEEYFCRYLAVEKVQKERQNRAMSVGSAFDAYVKAWLFKRIFGDTNPEFQFDTLFEKQVEQQNRDFAIKAGAECFISYRDSGALGHLFKILEKSTEIQFEFTATGHVEPETGLLFGKVTAPDDLKSNNPVVLLGKPDLVFKHHELRCTLDWKVNGYTSATGKSPMKGYVDCQGKMHKECQPVLHGNIQVNLIPNIQEEEPSWASQISTYAWLTGVPVGGEFIALVDQIVCKPGEIRTAKHRCYINSEFQIQKYKEYQNLWDCIHSGHIFRNLSPEASEERCAILSSRASVLNVQDEKHEWLKRIS